MSMPSRTLIIAEAGVNHNGDILLARQLVDAAADAGADIVKFQTFKAENLVTPSAKKAEYQFASDATETQFEMLKRLEMSDFMHQEIIKHCKARGIEFLSTGFDLESIEKLNGIGLRLFKIPSGEITNLPYLRKVGSFGKQVIMSTGMASLEEVKEALQVLYTAGLTNEMVTVLHCTTEYPAPIAEVNLNAMTTIKNILGTAVGYSDHTRGIEVPIAAVALGASVIEKHLTLSRTLEGPDHAASLEPNEFAEMVKAIRNVELALGDGTKDPSRSELKNIAITRKSIVASQRIFKGQVFTTENLTVKRPGSGISPMKWDLVIGRTAVRDFEPNELIEI
jgi:N,N'-diacetyllegionaminate synthase